MAKITNQALERLKAGDLSLGVGIRISPSPAVGRAMAEAGFDWLFIDMEHGTLSIETCAQISAAALSQGIAPLVRVPPGELGLATRALEGGALGIVMPNVKTAEEAQALANLTKFRPIGLRNVGGPPVHTSYTGLPPEKLAELFNETTLTVAMVETPEAIQNVDEIAAVQGVDVVMIGGNDLTTTLELSGQTDHPEMIAAFEALTNACRRHNKWAGMGGVNILDHAKTYVEMGVQFILGGADTGFLAAAAHGRAKDLRSLK